MYSISTKQYQDLSRDKTRLEQLLHSEPTLSKEAEHLITIIQKWEPEFIQKIEPLIKQKEVKNNSQKSEKKIKPTQPVVPTQSEIPTTVSITTITPEKHSSEPTEPLIKKPTTPTPQIIPEKPKPINPFVTQTINQLEKMVKQCDQEERKTNISRLIFADFNSLDQALLEIDTQYNSQQKNLSESEKDMLNKAYIATVTHVSTAIINLALQSLKAMIIQLQESTQDVQKFFIQIPEKEQIQFLVTIKQNSSDIQLLQEDLAKLDTIYQKGVLQNNLTFAPWILNAITPLQKNELIACYETLLNAVTKPVGSYNMLIATWHRYFSTIFAKISAALQPEEKEAIKKIVHQEIVTKIMQQLLIAMEIISIPVFENKWYKSVATLNFDTVIKQTKECLRLVTPSLEALEKEEEIITKELALVKQFNTQLEEYNISMSASEFTAWKIKAEQIITELKTLSPETATLLAPMIANKQSSHSKKQPHAQSSLNSTLALLEDISEEEIADLIKQLDKHLEQPFSLDKNVFSTWLQKGTALISQIKKLDSTQTKAIEAQTKFQAKQKAWNEYQEVQTVIKPHLKDIAN